jgi:hypothetical protein
MSDLEFSAFVQVLGGDSQKLLVEVLASRKI